MNIKTGIPDVIWNIDIESHTHNARIKEKIITENRIGYWISRDKISSISSNPSFVKSLKILNFQKENYTVTRNFFLIS